jgi:hypothetical protein
LTIHALILLVEREKDMTELKGFWQKNAYRIGGLVFSLDDMEHGVLRCEFPHLTYTYLALRKMLPKI